MTNEQQVVDAARAAFADIIDEAPLAPDWASATGQLQRLHRDDRPRRLGLTLVGVAALVFVMVGSLAGLTLVLRSDSGIGSGGSNEAAATTSLADDGTATTTPVTPPTTSAAAIEQIDAGLVPALGPEPRFDTSGLGDEVITDRRGTDVTEPAGGTPEESLLRLRSMAQLKKVQLALMSDPDIRAVGEDVLNVGQVADRTGYVLSTVSTRGDVAVCTVIAGESGGANWACMDRSDRLIVFFTVSDNRADTLPTIEPDRLEAMYLVLDPDVSVIALEHSSGVKQWQRTYGGAALFVIEGVDSTGSFTVTAYDADGAVMDAGTFEPVSS